MMINLDVEAGKKQPRTRTGWNDRLAHWERPASDHEEAKIERAANIARNLIANSDILNAEQVVVRPQGSYFNNTNVRLEADMDLRVQPTGGLITRYAEDVDRAAADVDGGYTNLGRDGVDVVATIRDELARICRARFGWQNVNVGNKAVTVDGLDGSRADVDLVPALRFHWIYNNPYGGFYTDEGVIIYGSDGRETINFPQQHNANGITKRANTRHRFKKVVRMLKQLNYELDAMGAISHRAPSFLVECLVYLVEDGYFLWENDDRLDRLRRVVGRCLDLLFDEEFTSKATEINGIKFLFHSSQAWTLLDAKSFILAAHARVYA